MSNETRADGPKPLTIRELAERWKTTPRAIYNMRYIGTAPRCFKRGRNLMFPLAEVERWEDAGLAADPKAPHEAANRPPEPKTNRKAA